MLGRRDRCTSRTRGPASPWLLLPVLLIVLLLIGVAGTRPLAAQAGATAAGIVRDSAGAAVVAASVSIAGTERATLTDSSGRFSLDQVPAGTRTVEVRRLGFLPLQHEVTLQAGESVELELTLIARAVVVEQLVVRAPNTGLRGIVHDHDLEPIANAEISTTSTSRRIRTGADGRFTWTGFPHGSHLVRVTAEGYAQRVFVVTIPEGEGRQVSVRLDYTSRRRSNMDERDWADLGWRRRWSSGIVTFLTEEQLQKGAAVRLSEDVRLRQVAGQNPCVRVNGRLSALPLGYFFIDEVAAVEVIPDGGVVSRGTRRRQSAALGAQRPAPSPDRARWCSTTVYVWLK